MKILLSEEQYGKLVEGVEIDEYKVSTKTDQDWIDEFKNQYPNWDYSNAEIYHDGGVLRIKNIYCKIHKHSFPEEGKNDIQIYHHKSGVGCKDCSREALSSKMSKIRVYDEKQWRKKLSNDKSLKNKIDFSKAKFSFVDPLENGPLVTNMYCKIHKKYFNGGVDNKGIRASYFSKGIKDPCPDCRLNNRFETQATSFEDWIKRFKSNENNSNYNYNKSEVYYIDSKPYINNIFCNVKGLDGKKHGFFAKDGTLATNHANGNSQCPKCSCESKTQEFIRQSKEIHGNRYVYDKVDFCDESTKIKNKRKILIGCKTHGYFFQDANNHKIGQGCPVCKESKGENHINTLLTSKFGGKYKILREKDASFEKLVGKRKMLPFDFYIPELKVVIEYDGQQHFYPVFGSSDYSRNLNYNKTFTNDNLKNDFIKNNSDGIKLIRVPYTMKFDEINSVLLRAIRTSKPNTITYIGEYPNRQKPEESKSQFKLNESKLSFENIISEKLRDMVPSPIYHHTTEERALGIMNSNMLKGSSIFPELLNLDPTLKHSKHKTMVSFTRDKNFVPDASIGNSGDGPRVKPDTLNVIFVADRNRLKTRYRVVPFDYSTLADKAWMDAIPRSRKNPEVEERVLTDRIYPLRQYITNIIYTGQDPEVQKKIDEYLSGIK